MTAKELFDWTLKELQTQFDKQESKGLASILFYDLLNIKYLSIESSVNEITIYEEKLIHEAIIRLLNSEPVQHVTGFSYFMQLKFKVNKNVLIPRPETEELVEWILQDESDEKLNVIDIGTGSGCIAISLKKNKQNWSISATDISDEALEIAIENSTINEVEINFIQDDISNSIISNEFDIIVSNPPYIFLDEADTILHNVLNYEPHLALFEPSEFYFYHKIIAFARKNLKVGGSVYVEINQSKSEELKNLFEFHFSNVILAKDLSNNFRMIKASGLK